MTASQVLDIQREYTAGVEPFRFRWADQEWELPHRKMLDFSVLLQVAQMQDKFADVTAVGIDDAVETLNDTFTTLMGAEQGARFAQVSRPLDVLMLILSRWSEHSGGAEESGESLASTGSSASTGRPSKRTSSGSSASGSPKPSSRRARKSATPRVSSSSASEG